MKVITISDGILLSGGGYMRSTLDTSLAEENSTHFYYNILPIEHSTERIKVA